MTTHIKLSRTQFGEQPFCLLENSDLSVTLFKYRSGIEAITLRNRRGFITVLPYMGQMIWDAEFDGHNLTMHNPFSMPRPGASIIDTYGCFAFHSGLLSNGCPAPSDDHPMHGEMPCAPMDSAWLILDQSSITLAGEYEYVKGFGHHYLATPSVRLAADDTLMTISMQVTNLASMPMPLQYMCHTNYCYVPGARFSQNLPDQAFALRRSVPAHVKPTPQWLAFTASLAADAGGLTTLDRPGMYDPEIVFFADRLSAYVDLCECRMHSPDGGPVFVTRFSTDEFDYATRWILYNGDQKVAAFILPATCRPEGQQAARQAGSLLQLDAGASRRFSVTTGLSSESAD